MAVEFVYVSGVEQAVKSRGGLVKK